MWLPTSPRINRHDLRCPPTTREVPGDANPPLHYPCGSDESLRHSEPRLMRHHKRSTGLDFGPTDLLQHYSDLDAVDRKRLELQEDCLLANTLHNLIAFMRGNDIDLVPPLSRQLIHDVYLVGSLWQNTIEMTYLEIFSEFLILRDPEGPLLRRWWFDQIINFTHPPNSDMVCLQTVIRGKREHFTFKSENAHRLFNAIASAIKDAASKRQQGQLLTSLGAEVNAIDADTNATVVIRFTQIAFCLQYAGDFKTIPLEMIKRCYISADDIFSIEAFETGESCSDLPLYANVRIAPGLSTLAVCCVPLVSPVSPPPSIVYSAASACVGRGVLLRLSSPRQSSLPTHVFIQFADNESFSLRSSLKQMYERPETQFMDYIVFRASPDGDWECVEN
ncbi:unnamed protein product [Schistocephalus solidus]|uniref:PAS domain-containing protein n=1 Tax=Schistocephalus solidus TaxID=70667 RepID=A0A183TF15_SCHSO|nr:unnamed protein product [Schistocephalus solidus]